MIPGIHTRHDDVDTSAALQEFRQGNEEWTFDYLFPSLIEARRVLRAATFSFEDRYNNWGSTMQALRYTTAEAYPLNVGVRVFARPVGGQSMSSNFDSRPDTYAHIQQVQRLLNVVICDLWDRLEAHDQSKLHSPEVEVFDEFTPRLAGSTYGSAEYKGFLAGMKPALDHHYSVNSHHPEHYPNGIADMSLLDVLEMLVDWKAATMRHNDGDIRKSIEINQARFGYSDELKQVLLNTLPLLEEEG